MKLQLDDDFKCLIGEAIIRSIDEKAREAMIGEAVAYLLKPRRLTGYGPETTPIEDAWHYAVSEIARTTVAQEISENTAVKEKIRSLILEAVEKVMQQHDAITDRMAEALIQSLRGH